MHIVANRLVLLALISTGLIACGGGGSSSSSSTTTTETVPTTISQTVTVTPSLGKISHADVKIYDEAGPAGGNLLAEGNTGSNGIANIQLTTHDLDPIVIEVSGNDQANYFDEHIGSTLPFPAGESLYAISPTPGSAAVTTLTHLSWALADENSLFPLDNEEARAVNEAIRQSLARELSDILLAPTVVDGSLGGDSLGDSPANLYAMKLAALATLSPSAGSPALATLDALAADVRDGKLYSGFAADWYQAIGAKADIFGNQRLELSARYQGLPKEAVFAGAGKSARDIIMNLQGQHDAAVYDSVDTDFETDSWDLFPPDSNISLMIGGDGTLTLSNDEGAVPGWSMDLDDAELENRVLDPANKAVEVRVAGDSSAEQKAVKLVFRDGELAGFRIAILTDDGEEINENTWATVPVAHATGNYPPAEWTGFVNAINSLSESDRMLTTVQNQLSSANLQKCSDYEITGGMLQKTPATFLEVNPAQQTGWVNRMTFTETDFRQIGNITEAWISTYSAVRLNSDTDTVTWIEFGTDGEPAATFTTDGSLIALECGG